MWFYRALKRNVACDTITLDAQYTGGIVMPKLALSGDGTTGTIGTAIQIGTTAVPIALNTAGQTGIKAFFSSTATSDTTYGMYLRLDSYGAGVEAIAGRFKTLLITGAAGNAYGLHATLETDTSAGSATGQSAGIRGNLVLANRAITGAGRYYGIFAEIYPLGSSAALTTESAVLGINLQSGTGVDTKVAAISFMGADATTKMIYTHNPGATFSGSIKILVNGAQRWLYFASSE
jgi:hypothetical protein